ncbi:LOW QUALITY PROTEIN: Eukaryotic/viral aspartic protease [Phytophthora megakarya]|uniref:Eukaryotic/viral aspartic protease n=1 Tax=Phytophthora megakarya TaxID=4795 RepID=A0A225WZ86_9STRA|nr:LOW QUALITY PROTEIN: Eukaryotic/viral aspartic protease [Phytophthora megakarya]
MGLVDTVECKTTPMQGRRLTTRPALPPPEYASSEDSDSVESPKRMPMRRPPRVMQLAATPAKPETPSSEWAIPKALEDAIVRLMQLHPGQHHLPRAMRVRYPCSVILRRTRLHKSRMIKSVISCSPSRSKRGQVEDSNDLFDLDAGLTGTAADVSTATAGAGVARVRLSVFSERMAFNGKHASEEKNRVWFNCLKSESRRNGMTRDEVCTPFGDVMYLQLEKSVKKSLTELTEQFRVQYYGKGVSMASLYYHASKHVDETPLEYLYRLNVAGMRAKIRYFDGTPEEKHEHVELFINTLGAGIGILPHADGSPGHGHVGEKSSRVATRLSSQEEDTFRLEPIPPEGVIANTNAGQAVDALQMTTDDYDSGREGDSDDDQICDQDRDDQEQPKMFVTRHASQPENARRDVETGGKVHDRPKCRLCGSRRHSAEDCWSLLTYPKCAGQHPTDHCLRACKACGVVHDAGEWLLEEFFNQLCQCCEDVKLGRSLAWKPVRDKRSMYVYTYVAKRSRDEVSKRTTILNDNTCESKMVRTALGRALAVSTIRSTDKYACETATGVTDFLPGERREYWKHYAPDKWYKQAKMPGKLNNG